MLFLTFSSSIFQTFFGRSVSAPVDLNVGVVYLLNFLIGRETQFCNKVFSRGGYLKKGENCLVVCKNLPVCDFKIKEPERALKVSWVRAL